jgi:D-alanyl-D-alanine dipeptidase
VKLLAVAALLVACRNPSPSPSPSPSPLRDAPELITAVTDDWTSTRVTLRRYARDGERWRAVGEPWPATIGRTGLAWGDGLHGDGAPSGRAGPIKREGDGKTPAGAFAIRAAYGSAAKPPTAKLPYTPVDARWKCVDDPASKSYARIVDRERVAVDWRSAEEMHRDDQLYTWVIDIAHNAPARPARGSCIFFHVWRDPDATTQGCTAMAEPRVAELVATLDPRAVYVALPRAEYDALATSWGLPAL